MTQFADLSAPFAAKDLEWRIGRKSKDGKKAAVLCYLDARAVMDRLDEVMAPTGWQDSYLFAHDGSVICTLSLCFDGTWIAKADGAEKTNIEATKGGISSAFKRAAVKWGIGRYLYDVPEYWRDIDQYGKFTPPALPAWALPKGDKSQARVVAESGEPVDTETGELLVVDGTRPNADVAGLRENLNLPPMDAPRPAAKASPGVPEWWPLFRQLKQAKRVTDSSIEEVIGAGPTLQAVSAWLEANTDTNFTQLVTLAEEKQKQLMGAR